LFNRVRIENDDPRRRGGGSSESRKTHLSKKLNLELILLDALIREKDEMDPSPEGGGVVRIEKTLPGGDFT